MKKIFTILSVLTALNVAQAQNPATLLCDFEATQKLNFQDYSGKLDSMFVNPMTTGINTSSMCARYIRDTARYDNIKFYPRYSFYDISPYAQVTTTSKITMKVMSTMPAGSMIEVQLGTRKFITYPQGVHSTYMGTTTATRQWEMVTFNLSQNLSAGQGYASATGLDKMVVLFNPNSNRKDTVYFDDVMGPEVDPIMGVEEMKASTFMISQNVPNPAKESTSIKMELTTPGYVNLTIYDVLGKAVSTPVNNELNIGSHNFEIETQNMPNGIYFYTVKKGSVVQTRKMVVAK